MAKVRITQVRSLIGYPHKQRLTLKALSLGKINSSVELEFTPQIQGMVRQVSHLVTTENI
jgi:large subunit ribosomal protein L30